MPGFDLEGFLPYQLAVLSARVSREFSALYRDRFGISVAEWRVVAHLSQSDAVSVREIHRRVDMDKSKVSRAASRLEQNGYVEKSVSEGDKRLISLCLTKKGRAMVDELVPLAGAYEAQVLAELGPAAPAFRDAVDRLVGRGAP